MNETRNCQNCKQDFQIVPEDFDFYTKMEVPPPTFCRECRLIRRYVWRNNRSLYKCECALCKKPLIGMYREGLFPIMCSDCYNGDGWDQFAFATDIDWTKDFLSQLNILLKKQPRIFQYRIGNVSNSDYGNSVVNTKDAYLSYSVIGCENILYSESVDKTRDSLDSFLSQELDQCSWNILSEKNYNSHGMLQTQSCIDSYFLFDCTNCQNCCLSSNLRNQQYVFRNQKLSKEEYQQAVSGLALATREGWGNTKSEFNILIQNSIHRYAQIFASQNVTGDYISNSKNVTYSFEITQQSEDVRYSTRIIAAKDVMDCYAVLNGALEYETMSGTDNSYHQIGCVYCFNSSDVEYSLCCRNVSNCFGCVGLKNAQYCIFNKQYSKEEYETLVPKLRAHMTRMPYVDAKGRTYTYGEFYPYELSPFAYNETLAQDYFPLNKQQAEQNGFQWKDQEVRRYPNAISVSELPQSAEDTSEDILSQTILCAHKGECNEQCTVGFRLIDRELSFYKNKGLPLPELCPNCRHYDRLKYRNKIQLYTRGCGCNETGHDHIQKCPNTFDTSYAPEHSEKVYCESCYQKSVL